jgi:hypothetical protein
MEGNAKRIGMIIAIAIIASFIILLIWSAFQFGGLFSPESPPHPVVIVENITVYYEGRIEIKTQDAEGAGPIDNMFIILRAPDGYRQVGEPKLWHPKDSIQFDYSQEIVMRIDDVAPLGALNQGDRIIISCDGGVPDGRWELYIGLISTSYGCGGWTWITGPHYQWTSNYSAPYSFTNVDANTDPLGYFHFVTRWSLLDTVLVLAIIVTAILVSLILWRKYRAKGS